MHTPTVPDPIFGLTPLSINLVLVVVVFLLALLGAILLTPITMRLAIAAGVVDAPGGRRVHTTPTPRWGGLAMCAAFLIAVALATPIRKLLTGDNLLNPRVLGILLGGVLITVLGALDDKYNVPAKVKLLGQILVATVLVFFGVRLLGVQPNSMVIFDVNMSTLVGTVFTVLWVVAVTNTINLIDGLDGLAAGISGIAALTFVVIGMVVKNATGEAMLAAALVGVCAGFLRYNFHPAKVFMGDAGSHFLGFTIAAISVLQNWKMATGVAFAVPMLILAVPIFDTTFAIIRRMSNKQPIFSPDKGHLHHRLLDTGMNQRQVVLTIYLLTVLGCALALLLSRSRMPQ